MRCVTSTRRSTEYVKSVKLQRDNEKPINLLVQPFTLFRDQKFVRTSSTEEVNVSDVISPVSVIREGDVFRLSLAGTTFLEAYFPLDTAEDTSEYIADDGRRVQLRHSRTGRLRQAVIYTVH